MIIFLDTSDGVMKLWLKDDSKEYSFHKELNRDLARDILSFMTECLISLNLDFDNLKAIIIFAGPGSFTGLRIGITVANTLADSLKIPIIGALNSDKSKNDEGENDWREIGLDKLRLNDDDKIVIPFYGAEANITKQRK